MPRSVWAIERREAVWRWGIPSRAERPGGTGPARGSSVPISDRNTTDASVRITLVLGLALGMYTRTDCPSDLIDAKWAQVERFIPAPKSGGRPAKYQGARS